MIDDVAAWGDARAHVRAMRWLKAAQNRFPVLQAVALVVVLIYGSRTLPGLTTWPSLKTILVLAALTGLASVGQTVVVLLGGIDLSISGLIVASALTISALREQYDISFELALLLAVVASGLFGVFTGYVCHRYRIQPLIITLAIGTVAVGIVQAQTGGAVQGSAPEWLGTLTSPATSTFGLDVPPLVVIWVFVALAVNLFLKRAARGRRLLATGANPQAAEYSLINTRYVWAAAFLFSGVISALVGVLLGGFAGAVDGRLGDPYLFQSVIAVIVGGTVFGGPGDYLRTVVGTLFLTVLTTVLVGHGAEQADQQIVFGLVILLAVAAYGRERRFQDRI